MRRRGLLGDLSSSLKGFISLQELSAASPFWFLYTLYAALPKNAKTEPKTNLGEPKLDSP